MKKLMKPGKAIEEYTNDRVEAFCEFGVGGCGSVCAVVCTTFSWCTGLCGGVEGTQTEEEILF